MRGSRPVSSRCLACIASTRPASRSVRSPRPCTTAKGSTSRSTTAASARASVRPIVPTKCAVSIGSATPTARNMPISATKRLRLRTIRMSPCARAASWRNARIASNASAGRAARRERENRTIAEGEVVTACQSACPTRAISFGDKNDRAAQVNALREEPHHYALLGHLGTRPRTTYLARPAQSQSRLCRSRRHERCANPRRCAGGRFRPAAQYEAVNALVSAPLLRRHEWRWRAWWIGFAVSGLLTAVMAVDDRLAAQPGRRHLGLQHHRRLGLSAGELRLVDRHRQCRHADLLDAAVDAAKLARLDQPLRRGDDAVCRLNRRPVSDTASRADRNISIG